MMVYLVVGMILLLNPRHLVEALGEQPFRRLTYFFSSICECPPSNKDLDPLLRSRVAEIFCCAKELTRVQSQLPVRLLTRPAIFVVGARKDDEHERTRASSPTHFVDHRRI
jgi:hypothetical protein